MNQLERETDPEESSGLVVPYGELSEDALNGVLEEFVLREGTEYGDADVPLRTKVAQVRLQLQRREAEIVFDAKTATVSVVLRPIRR